MQCVQSRNSILGSADIADCDDLFAESEQMESAF